MIFFGVLILLYDDKYTKFINNYKIFISNLILKYLIFKVRYMISIIKKIYKRRTDCFYILSDISNIKYFPFCPVF